MKEWTIRIFCVFLGVVLTLGTTKIIDLFSTPMSLDDQVTEQVVEIEAEPIVTEEVTEEEPINDFELEAELKYQEMLDTKPTEAVEEPEEEYPPNSIEAAPVKWIKEYPMINSDATLEEKNAERSSYEETMAVNAFDKKVIENSKIDFSKVKITVIGDSITEGNTLPEEEKDEYNWPAQLKNILGCKEVVNLGKGGSTVSKVIDHYPMCNRWTDIEPDSDIIIVMGGSNDALFMDKWMFGELEYEKRMTEGTFCGDLDSMLGNMKWKYRDHNDEHYCKLICINPPSTILNDGVYAIDPGNMVQQKSFAEAINTIAPQCGFEVIDMYNNNILNSHDPDINANFIPDGIHGNKEGYRIMAEYVASQIIQRIEQ